MTRAQEKEIIRQAEIERIRFLQRHTSRVLRMLMRPFAGGRKLASA